VNSRDRREDVTPRHPVSQPVGEGDNPGVGGFTATGSSDILVMPRIDSSETSNSYALACAKASVMMFEIPAGIADLLATDSDPS